MQAFEFNADVQDNIIKLPDEYRGKLKNKVKVIILQSETNDPPLYNNDIRLANFLSFVDKHRIELPSDYKFNREELNERN